MRDSRDLLMGDPNLGKLIGAAGDAGRSVANI